MHFATDRTEDPTLEIEQTQTPGKFVWKKLYQIDEKLYGVWKKFEIPQGRVKRTDGVEVPMGIDILLDGLGVYGGICGGGGHLPNESDTSAGKCVYSGVWHSACYWMHTEHGIGAWNNWIPNWEDCRQGTYIDSTQTSLYDKCQPCNPGRFTNVRAQVSCTQCQGGKAQTDFGKSECNDCPAGRYSEGDDRCGACELGRYASMSAMSECTMCPAGFSTLIKGAESNESCVCAAGSYMAKSTGRCAACPLGMECPAGSSEADFAPDGSTPNNKITPNVTAGYYTSREYGFMYVFECIGKDEKLCPGGPPESCKAGSFRNGIGCSLCPENYLYSGDNCEECKGGEKAGAAIGLVFLAVIPVVLYAVFNVEHHWKLSPKEAVPLTSEVIIELLQVAAAISTIEVTYPTFATNLMDAFAVFQFDLAEMVPMPCIFKMVEDMPRYLASTLIIPGLVLVIWLSFPIYSRVIPEGGCLKGYISRWDFAGTFNLAGKILNMLFISQVMFSVIPMQCYLHPNGQKSSLRAYPSTLCDSDERTGMLIIGILSLSFCLAIFVYLIWELNRAPRRLSDPDGAYYMKKITFTIEDFKLNTYYWNIIGKVQELFLGMVIVVDPDNTRIQLLLFLLIFIISIVGWTRAWPYKLPIINLMTVIVYGAIVAAMLLFTNEMPPANGTEDDFGSSVLGLLLVIGLAWVACTLMIVGLQRALRGPHGNMFLICQLAPIPSPASIANHWDIVRDITPEEMEGLLHHWEAHELNSLSHVLHAIMPDGNSARGAFGKVDSMRSDPEAMVDRLSKRLSGEDITQKKTDDARAKADAMLEQAKSEKEESDQNREREPEVVAAGGRSMNDDTEETMV
jgi:hypothetical protein